MSPRTSSALTRLRRSVPLLLLAAVTYLPLVFTQPGQVGADTKTYLYLDPGRLLRDAAFLWDPGVGLGAVTHQNIGYLWPMGPFYWFFDAVGVPDWMAQRLWLASVIFAAGAGVLYLLRTLGWPTGAAGRSTTGPTPRPPRPLVGRRHGRGRPGLRPEPLPAGLRRPHLGDPAAVGRRCPG